MDKAVNSMLGITMEKVKEMVDINTVVGTPFTVDGVTMIPVSRVTYGFAGGGSDLPSKQNADLFGGGSGAGITVTPIAFLTVKDGTVSVLPIITQPGTVDAVISKLPDAVNQVGDIIRERREKKNG